MKTLLIDNYDSFTFNLFQLLAEVNGTPPLVFRNDEISFDEILASGCDNIVVSPGPGTPANASDFGVCSDAVSQSAIPVLGVCLGHQGLCHHYGARVGYAPQQMHGRLSRVHHNDSDLFHGLPSPFAAVRYHSLAVYDLPECFEKLAWTEDGVIMGVRHRSRPLWGVQFHPESICTEHGARMMRNFLDLTRQHQRGLRRAVVSTPQSPTASVAAKPNGQAPARHSLRYRKLPFYPDSEAAYVNLYGDSSTAFWLDSSMVASGLSRYSFMGASTPDNGEIVSYDMNSGMLKICRGGHTAWCSESIFSYLSRRLDELQVDGDDLPFPFAGGYVGYLGYELKAECGAFSRYQHQATTPDAVFILADRFIAFDHVERCAYLAGLDGPELDDWFDSCEDQLWRMSPPEPWKRASRRGPIDIDMRHIASEYLARVDECLHEIREGNSYEVCLTNQMCLTAELDTLNCYRALRSVNPAPYSAYLSLPEVNVLCSSPERFLQVRNGWVESKPIKGTSARGKTPEEDGRLKRALRNSEKDRAENLMIVDLLRNDLGSICEVGSVSVPKLFDVETYPTVHQLVSTVQGKLPAGRSAVDCVRASFPGGSMTGAPKIRTMEIIDRLEDGPRGVYSGTIGYFGLDGSADLNIVIRTIVAEGDSLSIGVGGAIVALSDPESELEETYLKGEALIETLEMTLPASLAPARPLAARPTHKR